MPDSILLDEIHVSVTVPDSISDADREQARRVLNGQSFRIALSKAVRNCFRRYSALKRVRVTIGS